VLAASTKTTSKITDRRNAWDRKVKEGELRGSWGGGGGKKALFFNLEI